MILYIRPVPLCGETTSGKKNSPIRQPSARLSAVESTLRSRSHDNNNSSRSSVGSLPWLREDLQVSRRLACGLAIEPGFSHGCCQSLRSWRGPTGPGPEPYVYDWSPVASLTLGECPQDPRACIAAFGSRSSVSRPTACPLHSD